MDRFRRRARALRGDQTGAEARLWQALRGRRLADWKFRRQHPVDRYIVDFASLEGRLVVEVDGATHATDGEIIRDEERSRVIESCGYTVIRVTNRDVYDNLDGVLEAILEALTLPRR